MGKALQASDLDGALAYGNSAVSVAIEHALFHLAVPVHVTLAASLLARQHEGRWARPLRASREPCATRSRARGPSPWQVCARKLQLQACMAHGAGLAGLKRWREAASQFERTMPLAAAAQDSATALDCSVSAASVTSKMATPHAHGKACASGLCRQASSTRASDSRLTSMPSHSWCSAWLRSFPPTRPSPCSHS